MTAEPRVRFYFPPAAPLPALLTVALLAGLSGCARDRLALLDPEAREQLRSADPLQPPSLIDAPAPTLEEVPRRLTSDVVRETRDLARGGSGGRETVALELAEARRDALVNNLNQQVTLYDPAIAEQVYNAERAKFEAVLAASASYEDRDDTAGFNTDTLTLRPEVRVPLETGGTASVGLPFSYSDSEVLGFDGQPQGELYTAGLDLAFSQPLLRGAGVDVNTASIDIAGLQLRQADARTKLASIRLLANTEQTYWRYYAAYENLKLQLRQYELASQQLGIARRLVDEGVRTRVEVIRARSGLARRLDAIVQAETERRQQERSLKTLINQPRLPVDEATAILPRTQPQPRGFEFLREQVAALAIANRMELFENQLQERIDRRLLQVNENAELPDLRFDFRYGFSGSQPSFDDALDQLFDSEGNGYTVGLSLELPLEGNRAAHARFLESRLRLAQTRASRAALQQSIIQEVYNAIDAVEQNWQRVLANRVAITQARATYAAENELFQLGENTTNEVLDALSALSEAESAQIRAISDFQISLVDLAFATGTVLGQGGVLWSAPDAYQDGVLATDDAAATDAAED